MAISRVHTFVADAELPAAELEDEFNNIIDNALSLISPLTGNLAAGGFKITGLGAGSALTDSASITQVQNQFGSYLTSVAGTNTITATATPTPAYAVGQRFTFIPAVTNTGAVTLNISSVGAGAVQLAGVALAAGELIAGSPYTVLVTATTPVFELLPAPQVRGTWTPVLTFATPGDLSVAYSTQVGIYTKIGNVVIISFSIVTSTFTHTTATGGMRITGIPFTPSGPTGMAWVGSLEWSGITKTNFADADIEALTGQAYLMVGIGGSGQALANLAPADMPTGGSVVLRGTLTYQAAS